MKVRFLSFAIISAIISMLIVAGVNAETDSDPNTSRIQVTSDTSFSLTLAGMVNSYTYTGFTTAVSNPVRTYASSTLDYLRVEDFSGVEGHEIDVSWDDETWYYGGTDSDKVDIANYPTTATNPGLDEITFVLTTEGALNSFSEKDSGLCTGSSLTMTFNAGVITSSDFEIAQNTESCAGFSRYQIGNVSITGPSNGFGSGSYTQTGTYTLSDGWNP